MLLRCSFVRLTCQLKLLADVLVKWEYDVKLIQDKKHTNETSTTVLLLCKIRCKYNALLLFWNCF